MRRDIRELDPRGHCSLSLNAQEDTRVPREIDGGSRRQARRRGLRTQPALQALGLGFLSLQTGRAVSVVYATQLHLWSFAVAALAD